MLDQDRDREAVLLRGKGLIRRKTMYLVLFKETVPQVMPDGGFNNWEVLAEGTYEQMQVLRRLAKGENDGTD